LEESVEDCASFNRNFAEQIVGLVASSSNVCAVVGDVQERSDTIVPSLGLNTVALLEAGSKATGKSPKHAMNVRSREGIVYSAGFISYPRRTEMTRYDPKGFDVRSILREHASHEAWGVEVHPIYTSNKICGSRDVHHCEGNMWATTRRLHL
jgi:DNA topoisomerase IA